MTKPNQEEKHDRHAGHGSATHNEQMKKHGAGKGNWGVEGQDEADAPLDPRDPNYDSEGESKKAGK